jgi:hypothetical protein
LHLFESILHLPCPPKFASASSYDTNVLSSAYDTHVSSTCHVHQSLEPPLTTMPMFSSIHFNRAICHVSEYRPVIRGIRLAKT